jgi:DNA replication protein DnaC
MVSKSCPECGGEGYVVETRQGAQVAVPCKCRVPDRATRTVERACIPGRYRNRYTFDTYRPANESQNEALMLARRYAEEYPALPETANGILFLGPCGVGKTHLAVSILQEIVVRKAMPALFVDLNDLYREIRASYGRTTSEETEYDILAPLQDAPLLLIDELGCVASPWAQDTLHYLVSQRYNEQRPTLLTTNYLDAPPPGEVSLEDRIGTRTRSRLSEMCRTVFMDGPDHRRR